MTWLAPAAPWLGDPPAYAWILRTPNLDATADAPRPGRAAGTSATPPRLNVDKRRISTSLATRVVNLLVRWAVRHDLAPRSYAILETTGRRSGLPRRTPVGHAIDSDTVWIVAEHGSRAGYVHNIRSNPRVRIKLRDGWRSGTARVLDEDDPRARLRRMGLRLNALVVRLMGTTCSASASISIRRRCPVAGVARSS